MVVDAIVEHVDVVAQALWVEVDVIARQIVEPSREHAQDVARLVVDDSMLLGVPEDRHARSAVEVRIGRSVVLAEIVEALDPVDVLAAAEAPATSVADRIDDGDRDRLVQALEVPSDQGSMRPRAGVADVEVVAAASGLDPRLAKRALLALKSPVRSRLGRLVVA